MTIRHGTLPKPDALYDLLEREVIPEFYSRDENGIPTAWVARMRESMAQLTPRFSASRTVREYTEQHYLPAAASYRERAANKGAVGQANGRLAARGWTRSGARCASETCGLRPMRITTRLKWKSS